MKKILWCMSVLVLSLSHSGYGQSENTAFQFISVNHVYMSYAEGRIALKINLSDNKYILKNKERIIFSDFYSPTRILLVTVKYETGVNVHYFRIYDIERGLVSTFGADKTEGQDVFYLNDNILYRYDGENLIAFSTVDGKVEWSRRIRFDDTIDKFWYDARRDVLFANCKTCNGPDNCTFRIVAVKKNSIIYKSTGRIIGLLKSDSFERMFFVSSDKLLCLNTKTMISRGIDIIGNGKLLSDKSRYLIFSGISGKQILGVEHRTENLISRLFFGYGYNPEFEYYICNYDGANTFVKTIKIDTEGISTENIRSVR